MAPPDLNASRRDREAAGAQPRAQCVSPAIVRPAARGGRSCAAEAPRPASHPPVSLSTLPSRPHSLPPSPFLARRSQSKPVVNFSPAVARQRFQVKYYSWGRACAGRAGPGGGRTVCGRHWVRPTPASAAGPSPLRLWGRRRPQPGPCTSPAPAPPSEVSCLLNAPRRFGQRAGQGAAGPRAGQGGAAQRSARGGEGLGLGQARALRPPAGHSRPMPGWGRDWGQSVQKNSLICFESIAHIWPSVFPAWPSGHRAAVGWSPPTSGTPRRPPGSYPSPARQPGQWLCGVQSGTPSPVPSGEQSER